MSSNQSLKRFFSFAPYYNQSQHELNLSKLNFKSDDIPQLISFLSQNLSIKSLTINIPHVREEKQTESLINAISKLSKLESITLIAPDGDTIDRLTNIIINTPSLNEIAIIKDTLCLDDKRVIALAKSIQQLNLRALTLEGCFGDEGIIALAKVLEPKNSLKHLSLYGSHNYSSVIDVAKAIRNKDLYSFKLIAGFDDNAATVLADSIKDMNNLRAFSIYQTDYTYLKQNNRVIPATGIQGTTALMDALVNKAYLESLEIRHMYDVADTYVAETISKLAHLKLLFVNYLNDQNISFLTKAITNITNLEALVLKGSFTDARSTDIANALAHQDSLKLLTITGPKAGEIRDEGIMNIANEIDKMADLTELTLRGKFKDQGAISISKALSNKDNLSKLVIDGCGIKEAGATAISQAILDKNLHTLSVTGTTDLNKKSCYALIGSIANMTQLEEFNVSTLGVNGNEILKEKKPCTQATYGRNAGLASEVPSLKSQCTFFIKDRFMQENSGIKFRDQSINEDNLAKILPPELIKSIQKP